jgi:hypothetical protein
MITQDELKSKLDYDPNTGIFTWKIKTIGSRGIGNIAGHKHKLKYIHIKICKKSYMAHRLAWLYMYGEFPTEYIDHIDCDKSNNKIENLRLSSNQQNQFNRGIPKNNTSGVKGVSWFKRDKKWQVTIYVDKKAKSFGRYINFDEAVSVAVEARKKHHGDFARE